MEAALIIGGVALFVVLLIFSHLANQRRQEALAAAASELGFKYVAGVLANDWSFFGWGEEGHPMSEIKDLIESFSPFGQGSSRTMSNLIYGRRGDIDWYFFDYRFSTGSGKNRQTHYHGIGLARTALAFPRLQLRTENVFDRIANSIGFRDIDFESEDFNRQYRVNCDDQKAAHDLIHPQVIEFLMANEPRSWQFGGPFLVLSQGGNYDVLQMAQTMKEAEQFLKLVPGYVRQDRQGHAFSSPEEL